MGKGFAPVADIKAEGKMTEGQMSTAMGMNAAMSLGNGLLEGFEKYLNFKLMNGFISLQRDQMTKYYDLQGELVGLNGRLIGSQEKVRLAELKTTKEIAELNFDYKKVETRARADAAVKIAKVNALSTQFYGQPTANSLPSISA